MVGSFVINGPSSREHPQVADGLTDGLMAAESTEAFAAALQPLVLPKALPVSSVPTVLVAANEVPLPDRA